MNEEKRRYIDMVSLTNEAQLYNTMIKLLQLHTTPSIVLTS